MAPQIILLFLVALGLGVEAERSGKPKTGNHNFFVILLGSAISFCILHAGGFFAPMGF